VGVPVGWRRSSNRSLVVLLFLDLSFLLVKRATVLFVFSFFFSVHSRYLSDANHVQAANCLTYPIHRAPSTTCTLRNPSDRPFCGTIHVRYFPFVIPICAVFSGGPCQRDMVDRPSPSPAGSTPGPTKRFPPPPAALRALANHA